MYVVSCSISLKNKSEDIWKVISSHGNLNFFHPFCHKNKVIEGDKISIKKDILIYLNGVVFEREFYQWDEMNGYELMIGKKNGKKSLVKWYILKNSNELKLKITVYPYRSSKILNSIYPIIFYIYIKPMLKSYLGSVLKGIKWYIEQKVPVSKNQFGRHSWFT